MSHAMGIPEFIPIDKVNAKESQILYSAVAATDWRCPEFRKILKIYKIDHFGWSRENMQNIIKKYKTEDSGGSRKNMKKDNRRQPQGSKIYSKYSPKNIC